MDREIAVNVDRRFVEQVTGVSVGDGEDETRQVVLDAGCLYPELAHLGQTLSWPTSSPTMSPG